MRSLTRIAAATVMAQAACEWSWAESFLKQPESGLFLYVILSEVGLKQPVTRTILKQPVSRVMFEAACKWRFQADAIPQTSSWVNFGTFSCRL